MKPTPKSSRRARLLLLSGVLAGVLVSSLGWHLGWVTPQEDWQKATGWSRIPLADRPEAGLQKLALQGAEGGLEMVLDGLEPEILWLGHSGFVLRWQGQTVLLDPNLSDWCTISRRVLASRIDADAIGPVDAVLISHPHFDHLDLPTLRAIGREERGEGGKIGSLVVPSGSESYVSRAGLSTGAIVSLRVGEIVRIGPLEVIAVATAHNGNRLHPFESERLALGYIVRSRGFALYYSGDTGFSAPFEEIRDTYHPRLAILPIGAYLPRFPMKYYHLSPEEAVEAAAILGVDAAIPCHFGTFALSLDRPAWALPRFARAARQKGVEWRMPRLLTEGVRQARRAGGKASA